MQVRWVSKFTISIPEAVLLFHPVTNPGRIRCLQPIYVLSPETRSRYVNVVHADSMTALNMSCHETNLSKTDLNVTEYTRSLACQD